MPVMTAHLFNQVVDIELNDEGEIMGYTNSYTGEELNFDDSFLIKKGYLQAEINDFMAEWHEELREHIRARGRDRLGDD